MSQNKPAYISLQKRLFYALHGYYALQLPVSVDDGIVEVFCFTEDIEDIGNCSQLEADYINKIETVKQKRYELVFENQIWRSENLYASLLGLEKKGIPDNIKAYSEFEYGNESTDILLL